MPTCPICQVEATAVRHFTKASITQAIREGLDIDIPGDAIDTDYDMCRCPNCTLEFADPMKPGNSVFYHWLAEQPWYFPENRWEWDPVIDALREKKTKALLEVGCGSGIFLKRLHDRLPELRGIGLDLTEGVVDTCRKQGLEVYQGYVEKFAEQYGATVGAVDSAAAFHCLEHVPDPIGFVRAMSEIVGKDGMVFVSTPYSPMCYERLWPDPLNNPPHHMTRWNEKSYRALGALLNKKVRFHLPEAATDFQRTTRTLGLVGRSQNTQRSKMGKIAKMLTSPGTYFAEMSHQAKRDRVNGQPAADVVLVQFY